MQQNVFPVGSYRVRAATRVAVLASVGFAACSPSAPEFEKSTVPLSVVSLGDTLLLGGPAGVVSGEFSETGAPSLGQVSAGRLLPDGGFVLANEGTTSLVLFDATSAYEGEVSAETVGDPPMQRVHNVAVLPDGTLLSWDRALSRISTFDRTGRFAGATRIQGRSGVPADQVLLLDSQRLAVLHHEPPRRYPRGFSRSEVLVTITNMEGQEVARIGPLPGRALYGAPRANILVPYGERLLASATNSRLFIGDGVESQILEYNDHGHPARRLSLPLPRTVITPADREEILSSYRRPTTGDSWMEALDASFLADSFPAFDRLVASTDGNLWLRKHMGLRPSSEWLVVDVATLESRPLSLPPGAEVLDAADGRLLTLIGGASDPPEIQIFQFGGYR